MAGLRPVLSDMGPESSVPMVMPAKNVPMMYWRWLGSDTPNSRAMVPMAGSMVSIDMATRAVSRATRKMNSFCDVCSLVINPNSIL